MPLSVHEYPSHLQTTLAAFLTQFSAVPSPHVVGATTQEVYYRLAVQVLDQLLQKEL